MVSRRIISTHGGDNCQLASSVGARAAAAQPPITPDYVARTRERCRAPSPLLSVHAYQPLTFAVRTDQLVGSAQMTTALKRTTTARRAPSRSQRISMLSIPSADRDVNSRVHDRAGSMMAQVFDIGDTG